MEQKKFEVGRPIVFHFDGKPLEATALEFEHTSDPIIREPEPWWKRVLSWLKRRTRWSHSR